MNDKAGVPGADRPDKERTSDDRGGPGVGQRSDPRQRLEVQAMVSIPGTSSRVYELQEISRGGMFLAFRDVQSTRLEFERVGVEVGSKLEVAFTVSFADVRHRFSVTGEIARITRDGIGVRFITHNPPQLSELRELFARAAEEVRPVSRNANATGAGRRRIQPPSDDAAWADWELLD